MSETPNGMIPQRFEVWFCRTLEFFTLKLSRTGLTPNHITLFSLGFGFLAGLFLTFGHMALALLFGFLMGIFDILDGQLAISTHQTSRYGGILDSTVDRYNESFLFIGLGVHYYLTEQPVWSLIIAIVLTGSILVSYVKARAEGALMDCPVGILQRSERLALLAIGVIFQGWILKTILLFMAFMTHFTVIQRLVYVRKNDEKKPADGNIYAQHDVYI
ncbi:CDP-alcohol phosphatidyltransferase family protein [candidate division KSB1 bacterium]|nr:CDP-alcohol phosphatidyltransferase family protein [candidate division KSB1 bacterium]